MANKQKRGKGAAYRGFEKIKEFRCLEILAEPSFVQEFSSSFKVLEIQARTRPLEICRNSSSILGTTCCQLECLKTQLNMELRCHLYKKIKACVVLVEGRVLRACEHTYKALLGQSNSGSAGRRWGRMENHLLCTRFCFARVSVAVCFGCAAWLAGS